MHFFTISEIRLLVGDPLKSNVVLENSLKRPSKKVAVFCMNPVYVSYWRRDGISWSSESREGPAVCRAKAVPSFLSYF